MAQAPQDPYYGVDGLHRAWAQWVAWIHEIMPQQWARLQALYDEITAAPPAPALPPLPPPAPPPGPLDGLSAEDRALAEAYIAGLQTVWQSTPTPVLCLRDDFDALPAWKLIALESLGAVIWRDLVRVYASPPGYNFGTSQFRSRWTRGVGWT